MGPGYEGPVGHPGGETVSEALLKLAQGFGEVSNIAAEALALLEGAETTRLSREEFSRVKALRERLEAACRSVS